MIRLAKLRTPQQPVHGEPKASDQNEENPVEHGDCDQRSGTFRVWPIRIRRGSTPGLAASSVPNGKRGCRAIEAIVSRGRTTCLRFCTEETAGVDGGLRLVGGRGL